MQLCLPRKSAHSFRGRLLEEELPRQNEGEIRGVVSIPADRTDGETSGMKGMHLHREMEHDSP